MSPPPLDLRQSLAVRRAQLLGSVHHHPLATDILLTVADYCEEAARELSASGAQAALQFVATADLLRQDAAEFSPARAGDAP